MPPPMRRRVAYMPAMRRRRRSSSSSSRGGKSDDDISISSRRGEFGMASSFGIAPILPPPLLPRPRGDRILDNAGPMPSFFVLDPGSLIVL